jgi:CelD/BcsL family acetyltransferase involved in cellulose biosynthesis
MQLEWSWEIGPVIPKNLVEEWRELVVADPDANVFHAPDIALTLAAIDPSGRPILGIARTQAGKLVGLLPLAVTSRRVGMVAVPLIRRLGTGAVDQLDLIIHPEHGLEVLAVACAAIQELRKSGNILDLRPLRVDSRLYHALCTSLDSRSPEKIVDFSIHHTVSLGGIQSWRELTNRSVRSNVSRGERDLATLGGTFSCCSSPDDAPAWLEKFRQVHRARQAELGRDSFLSNDQVAARFSRAISLLVVLDAARLNALWLADRMIAGHISLHWRDTVTSYRIAFDHEYRALSPGIVLLSRIIDQAIAAGSSTLDFGFGEDDYKQRWTGETTEVKALVANPRTQRYLLGRLTEEGLRFTSRPATAPRCL